MSAAVSKTLIHYLIQSYLLQRCFPGKFMDISKAATEVFCEKISQYSQES